MPAEGQPHPKTPLSGWGFPQTLLPLKIAALKKNPLGPDHGRLAHPATSATLSGPIITSLSQATATDILSNLGADLEPIPGMRGFKADRHGAVKFGSCNLTTYSPNNEIQSS
jgi:hypothetical protein